MNCFVILTTEANHSLQGVHDRMPLVLKEEDVKRWILDKERAEILLSQAPPLLSSFQEYEQQTLPLFF